MAKPYFCPYIHNYYSASSAWYTRADDTWWTCTKQTRRKCHSTKWVIMRMRWNDDQQYIHMILCFMKMFSSTCSPRAVLALLSLHARSKISAILILVISILKINQLFHTFLQQLSYKTAISQHKVLHVIYLLQASLVHILSSLNHEPNPSAWLTALLYPSNTLYYLHIVIDLRTRCMPRCKSALHYID